MSSQLLMDAKLFFPSQEAIDQFLEITNAKNIVLSDHTVEGIFTEEVVDVARNVFKAVLTVMPYYLSGVEFSNYSNKVWLR